MAGSVLFFRLALCALGLLSLRAKGLDHGGKEFYVTFLPYVAPNYEYVKLFITTPEQVSVTFTVSAPGLGYTRNATVDPGRVKEFTFNGADYALRSTTDRSKGIIIKTENERQIFVYGAQQVPYSMDSFLVLPPHDLGAESYTYIAAMIHTRDGGDLAGGWKDIHALIGIVSVEDSTHLTITPTCNVTIGAKVVAAGDNINVTLARAETLLIPCVGDLTGTKVTSNRPISFFCGDQCPNIPSGVPYCDQIVEQLPPVEAWGNKFVTIPLKTRRSFDVFRIVAASQGTIVNITCTLRNGSHGSVNTFHLNEGGFADVQVQSAHFCWVEADKRILLLQFAIGQKADKVGSDPFMALVPAVSHYTNFMTLPIVNSSLNDFTHYLHIIVPAEHYQPDQIFLDGQSLQSLALGFVAIVHNGETMAYATQVTVSATTHTLIHSNSSGVIGVVAYGFAYGSSYGHTGGLQLPTHFMIHASRRDDIISSIPLHSARLDHGGKEFYVTFLPYVAPNYEDVKLFITTPEQVSVTFTISAPGMGHTRTATVDPGRVKEVTFNGANYALRSTTDRSKGIIIKTENERQIYVYGAQQVPYSMDSFLVLPPHDLGAKSYTYMAAMIHTRDRGRLVGGWKDIHALIGIVSVEDSTHLTITPTRNVTVGAKVVAAGDSINVTLHRAETLLIQCVGDLTGTKVTSNRPISFFCGDQCPYIPNGVPACDQIVEQLPPVEAWGNKFVTVPLKTRRSFDVFLIVAASQDTTVNITCTLRNGDHGSVDTFHLNEGGFADVQVRSAHFCWVEADKRILLLQFAIGQTGDDVVSDPFMALVPAVSHYTNPFTLPIVNSTFNDFTHYLNIIIPAEHYQPDQIFLDSQSLQSLALEFVAIVHNGETMAYATQVTVNATTHTLMHGNSSGVIGVVAYGFAYGSSYGHTGGLQLPTHFMIHARR